MFNKKASDSEAKEEKKESAVKKGFDIEAKVKQIEESRLPQAEKDAYIRKLKNDNAEKSQKISFAVYCQRKKVKPHLREAMTHYPAAKGVKSCTFEGWEEIYKNF